MTNFEKNTLEHSFITQFRLLFPPKLSAGGWIKLWSLCNFELIRGDVQVQYNLVQF